MELSKKKMINNHCRISWTLKVLGRQLSRIVTYDQLFVTKVIRCPEWPEFG